MISGDVALRHFKDLDYEESENVKVLLHNNPDVYKSLNLPENPMEFLIFKGGEAKPRPSLATMFVKARTIRLDSTIKSPSVVAIKVHTELGKMAGIEQSERPLKSRLFSVGMGGCASAEDYFVDTSAQILSNEDRGQATVQVFHDSEGQPVFLKKTLDEPNALSLRPIEIEGLYMPPGSLVAIDRRLEKRTTGKQTIPLNPHEDYTYSSHQIAEPLSIAPLRITPWAYPKETDRALFACRFDPNTGIAEYNQSRAEIIETYQLQDFERAATAVLSICGVS